VARQHQDLVRCHIMLDRETRDDINLLFGEYPGFSEAIRQMLNKSMAQIRKKGLEKANASAVDSRNETDIQECLSTQTDRGT
jgi:hypothetical protein